MPLRSEAFIIVVFLHESFHSWMDELYRSSAETPDDLPVVPGCRAFEREDNLGLSVYCTSYDVPETPSSIPDNTYLLQIYKVYDLDIDRPLLNRLVNLSELRLPQNGLENFNSRMTQGLPNLRSLSLTANKIKNLSDDTFVHSPLLEKIDLSQNFIVSVMGVTHCMKNLVHLREINLADNVMITSLTLRDFAPLRNTPLQSLIMDGCTIERIDENAFEPLKKLSVLDLSFTLLGATAILNATRSLELSVLRIIKLNSLRLLSSLPAQFFRSLNMSLVEEIEISFNRLVEFPFRFNIYPALRSLDMTACNILGNTFPPDSFKGAPKLETLFLKENVITAIGKQFLRLTSLKTLDISSRRTSGENNNFEIEDGAFQSLVGLQYLTLAAQPIRRGIKRLTFHGLADLIQLQLGGCNARTIEEYAFETLHNLELLDLTGNAIENLDNYTFYGLRNVRSVNLRNNALTSLNRSNPFQHTPALETLNLNENKIRQLSPGIFDGLLHLGIIRLEENFLDPWHKRLLTQTVNLSFLDISKNRIQYFTPEMLEDVRHLELLDFSYNPLNCSACGMTDLQLWMRNTSTSISLLQEYYYKVLPYACVAPLELANISVLDAEMPLEHCIPAELDVVLISLGVTIPLLACVLLAFIVWHFLAWHIRYMWFRVTVRVRVYKETTKYCNYKYDAFVSYSPSDILFIRDHLVPALEGGDQAYRLCIPDRDFEASFNITENVFDAVQSSGTAILVLSNAYLESEWCKFDMNMAQHKLFEDTRSLILILLEEVDTDKMTKNLKYIIKTRTFIPWTNNSVGQRLFWERLRVAVARPNEKRLLKHIT